MDARNARWKTAAQHRAEGGIRGKVVTVKENRLAKAKQTEWRNRITGHGDEPLDAILFNPANWRVHPKAQQDALEGVLSQVGWVQDVIVNKTTGHLVDGHLRCQVAARNGEKTIPVVYVELDENEEALILATIDPIAAMAATDKAKLDELMRAVQSDDARVQQMMSEMAEKEGLEYGKKEPAEDPGAQVDKAEELREKWQVETGQLWQLGEHRLICGDCTDRAIVKRLMGGEKAVMGFFDPPYGISFQSNSRTASKKFDVLEGDNVINGDWIPQSVDYLQDNGALYICTRWDVYPQWLDLITPHIKQKNLIVWDKVDWSSGDLEGDYSPRHEFILFCVKGRHILRGHRDSNVWQFGAQNKQDYLHPTQKKVELPEFAIQKSSDTGDVVMDWFSGSGTVMIACERLGRKCRAVEISPAYVAVALERWSTLTGQQPELIR
jgi:DNA modification methylase